MGLFFRNYNKPGPGIEKDAPKKKGAMLFLEIFAREFTNLIKLNLLFFICCIPIVTIYPAFCAMTRVLIFMVRDEAIDWFYEFKKEFKTSFKRSFIMGIGITVFIILMVMANNFYSQISKIVQYIVVGISIYHVFVFMYIFPQISFLQLSLKNVIKNSYILSITCLYNNVIATALSGIIIFVVAWFYPLTMLLLPVILFSFLGLLNIFFIHKGMQKYVVPEWKVEVEVPKDDDDDDYEDDEDEFEDDFDDEDFDDED